LIRLVRRYKEAYETMAPGVLMKVDALTSSEGNGVISHGETEVPSVFMLKKKDSISEENF